MRIFTSEYDARVCSCGGCRQVSLSCAQWPNSNCGDASLPYNTECTGSYARVYLAALCIMCAQKKKLNGHKPLACYAHAQPSATSLLLVSSRLAECASATDRRFDNYLGDIFDGRANVSVLAHMLQLM